MSLPTWVLGDDYEDRDAAGSYVVHLHTPHFVVRVTQKRGCKLMLTHTGDLAMWEDIQAGGCAPAWFELLQQAARFWASQVNDPDYAQQPPEILSRPDFKPPTLLLCDSAGGRRTFIVHTPAPFFAAELVDKHWCPVAGDIRHPVVMEILDKISPPESW